MIFGEKIRIEDYIIEMLDMSPLEGQELLKQLEANYRPTLTPQAMYKALRKLASEEVINKTGNTYSLNRVWLQKIRQFGERHIQEGSFHLDILNLEDGDSVTYHFKNPFFLDITWGHLYDMLYDANATHQVMLNHHPHEWLILSRPETERYWLERFAKDKKVLLFNILGNTELDKQFKKNWSSDHIKINLGESYGLKPNQYLSVLGDYVFEITVSEAFEQRVHNFFLEHTEIDILAQEQIHALSKQKHKSKLKLSRNKKKADMWRKKFKKDFYIPGPYYLFEK